MLSGPAAGALGAALIAVPLGLFVGHTGRGGLVLLVGARYRKRYHTPETPYQLS